MLLATKQRCGTKRRILLPEKHWTLLLLLLVLYFTNLSHSLALSSSTTTYTTTTATTTTTTTTNNNNNNTDWSVECLVVVDKAAYDQWLGFQTSNITGRPSDGQSKSGEERERLARSEIEDYVLATFLGANLIWKGMEEHGVRLDLRIQDLVIVTDEVVVTPTANGKNVDSDTAYWAFLRWLVRNGYEFDHAVLLTGLNLVAGRRGAQGNPTTQEKLKDSEGYAYMNTMCETESVSLVEQHFTGVSAVVLAHEVAHTLNAYHDGDGNSCPRRSGHIMNDNNIGISPLRWKFSNCSADAVKRKLQALADTYDCLSPGSTRAERIVWRSDTTGNVDDSESETDNTGKSPRYMGQIYTADQMCQMTEGSHSYLCRHLYEEGRGLGRDKDICNSLYCLVNSSYCSGVAAAEGLPCGSGKRCLAGQCVPFPDVPEHVTDSCYAGDRPHPAWRGQTCKQVVESFTHICHDQWYKDFCCQSCQDVSTGDPSCPYGDAHSRCARYYCGTAWEAECCITCS